MSLAASWNEAHRFDPRLRQISYSDKLQAKSRRALEGSLGPLKDR
jgi:hypothetical protein